MTIALSTTNPEDLPELFSDGQWAEIGRTLNLSERQQQVGRLICRGWSPGRIAVYLGVDPDTAHRHVHSLFRLVQVQDALGLAVRLVHAHRGLTAVPTPTAPG